MERTFEDQCANIEAVLKEAAEDNQPGHVVKRLENFLDEFWGMTKVKPFQYYKQGNGWIGVMWTLDDGWCTVLMDPGSTEWSFDCRNRTSKTDEYHPNVYSQHSYLGKETFFLEHNGEKQYYYILPDAVLSEIKLPDTFEKEYTPLITKSKIDILWETNRYDGMTAGYVGYQGQVCYAEMVDETPFERHRMFAIHALSLPERVVMMINMARWNLVRSYSILWKLWAWQSNRKLRARMASGKDLAKEIKEQREKFVATHTLVGYVMDL